MFSIYKVIFGAAGMVSVSSVGIGALSLNPKLSSFTPKCRIFWVAGESGRETFSETNLDYFESGDWNKGTVIDDVKEACDASNPNYTGRAYIKSTNWSLIFPKDEQESLRKKHDSK